jgi:heme O synthase-like polyprenyltransferase
MAVQVECSTGAMAVELAVVGAAEVVVAAVVVVVVTAGVLGAAAVDAATDADDGTDALMTGLSARPAVELVHPPTSAATVTAPATIAERLTGRSADRSSTAGSRP